MQEDGIVKRRMVDLTLVCSVVALTVVALYQRAVRVDIAYPITEAESRSYGLRGDFVGQLLFGFAASYGWAVVAWRLAGRWADRKR
jgi:hypothetical protein